MPSIPRTVREGFVENLRDEIVRGDHVPGHYLRLEELAARSDLSTMPAREALRDPEAEGLVTIFPHWGAVVIELSADELQDVYNIRGTLEAMAARLARRSNGKLSGPHTYPGQTQPSTSPHALCGACRTHLCEPDRMLRNRAQHCLNLLTFEVEADNFGRAQTLPQSRGGNG
jgi:hypothetical protein